MGTTPTTEPAWKAQPINMKQARFIGVLLPQVFPSNFSTHGEGGGFGQWVPGWTEPEEGTYPSQQAATLLGELGITKGNASDAISYLRRMKGRGDARLATFSDRLGLSVTGGTVAKTQAPQALDVQAIVAAAVAQALAQQAQAQQVVNGTPLEEVTPEDEPEQEQEVEAADSEGSDGPPLPF